MNKADQWSWLYAFFRPWVHLVFRLVHKEIKISGLENIPRNQPVIYAPNHQNALMDALAIVYAAPGQTVFLARADIFKKKITASILYFLKLLPIYRIRDGKGNLDKNEEIFQHTVNILQKKQSICLFPEAAHTNSRSMLPHKKAIPRIVSLAGEKTHDELDIQIVPVGITYNHYYRFRRKLLIRFGKPLSARQFYELRKQKDENSATLALRDHIFSSLAQLVVHIPQKEDVELFETIFSLCREEQRKKMKLKKGIENDYQADRSIMEHLNKTFMADPLLKEGLKKQLVSIKEKANQLEIPLSAIFKNKKSIPPISLLILFTIITLPFAWFGGLINGWLFYIVHFGLRKNVKDPQFWSSFSFVGTLLLFSLWYLLLLVAGTMLLKNIFISLFLIIFAHFSGIVGWELVQLWKSYFVQAKVKSIRKKQTTLSTEIHVFKEIITRLFNQYN